MKKFFMKQKAFKFILLTFALTFLFGCTIKQALDSTNTRIDQDTKKIHTLRADSEVIQPAAISKANAYADRKPLTAEEQAFWMKNTISVNGRNLPLNFVVSRILRSTNVAIKYQPSIRKNRSVTLNYSGTIKGALDEISEKTGYAYEVTEDSITWVDIVTKTFNIAFIPGTSAYLVGGTGSSGNGTTSNATNVFSSGSGVSSTGGLADSQYSSLTATLSVWEDLKGALNDLKSADGKVFVSQATTSVTVADHPTNVAAMSEYIKQFNHEMSRQVRLKVQVLELSLDKSHEYGVDWNAVIHSGSVTTNIGGKLLSSVSSVVGSSAAPVTFSVGKAGGPQSVISALSLQGKLSVVTEPTAVTMNNQIAEIRITRDTSYIQSVATNFYTQTGSSTTVTPGIVTDGFSLYLVPKVEDDKIYLQISSNLSTLLSLDTASTGTGQSNSSNVTISVPVLSVKKFNMRSLVQNGSTLIIGGFKQVHNETKQTGFLGINALGGNAVRNQNIETILLITPTIIENE